MHMAFFRPVGEIKSLLVSKSRLGGFIRGYISEVGEAF